MQYGYFNDLRKEYVIETPATPLPWINYLGNEDFFGLISNTMSGYCFYRDAKLQRLVRYRYHSVPADEGGRFCYIKEKGKPAWNPGFLPTRTPLDRCECRHGMGYTVFASEKDSLGAELTCFVPLGEACELHDLTLTNRSDGTKTVQVYGCVEWCLWNAVSDGENFQRNLNIAESEVEPGVIYHKTEYRERRDHYAYYGVNVPTQGFDTDRNTFLGHMGTWASPAMVRDETSGSSQRVGWYPIACHRLDVTLEPGQSWRCTFVLGYGQNPRDEKFIAPGSEVPLLEHIRRSVNFTMTHLGPHKLPLIGRADWNDCLNLNCFSAEPGESFQTFGPSEGPVAESVFIGGMFVKYGGEYAALCRRIGLPEEAEAIEKAVADMEKAILTDGWDGEWFLRAYDASRNKVGSHECREGQIYIEPQGFCTLAGIGKDTGEMKKALDSTRARLLGKYGVELLAPCYTEYYLELGEISSYPPGFKENGSVFCHNNPWIVCGEAVLGRGNEAFDIYKRICPAYLEEESEVHETEPYVYAQTVTGRASGEPGHAKNSWLTGTASWTFVSISQAILGVQPEYDGLRIVPCLPDELKELTVRRQFRGAAYNIHIRQTGTQSMTVNGQVTQDNMVPLFPAGSRIQVEITR